MCKYRAIDAFMEGLLSSSSVQVLSRAMAATPGNAPKPPSTQAHSSPPTSGNDSVSGNGVGLGTGNGFGGETGDSGGVVSRSCRLAVLHAQPGTTLRITYPSLPIVRLSESLGPPKDMFSHVSAHWFQLCRLSIKMAQMDSALPIETRRPYSGYSPVQKN